ncbi:MAG: hypothetical protein JKY94_06085 [Rhodobacteraceae bacterium]|nr:hypothetical protein [Paracoccaceae bacterium]
MSIILRLFVFFLFAATSVAFAKERGVSFVYAGDTFFTDCAETSRATCKSYVFMQVESTEVIVKQWPDIPVDVQEFIPWPRLGHLAYRFSHPRGGCDSAKATPEIQGMRRIAKTVPKTEVQRTSLPKEVAYCFSGLEAPSIHEFFVYDGRVIGDLRCNEDVLGRYSCNLKFFRSTVINAGENLFLSQQIDLGPVYYPDSKDLLANFSMGLKLVPISTHAVDMEAFEWLAGLFNSTSINVRE